jgi:hypothetical protein
MADATPSTPAVAAPATSNPITAAVDTVKADVTAVEADVTSFGAKVKAFAVKYGIPLAAFVGGAVVGKLA